jgi:hypothetical protein
MAAHVAAGEGFAAARQALRRAQDEVKKAQAAAGQAVDMSRLADDLAAALEALDPAVSAAGDPLGYPLPLDSDDVCVTAGTDGFIPVEVCQSSNRCDDT